MYSFRLPALLLIVLEITLVSASPVKRQFDECGRACFFQEQIPNGVNFGNCSTVDFGCLCKFQPFVQSAINCLSTRCSGSEQATLYTELELRCLQVGISVLPSATTPGITESITRTIIDFNPSTATGTGTALLASSPSSLSSHPTSQSSSALVLQRWLIPCLLGAFLSTATLLT